MCSIIVVFYLLCPNCDCFLLFSDDEHDGRRRRYARSGHGWYRRSKRGLCFSLLFFVISKLTLQQISKELQTCNVTVYDDVRKRISTCFYVLQFRVNLTLIVNLFYLQHDSDDESKF